MKFLCRSQRLAKELIKGGEAMLLFAFHNFFPKLLGLQAFKTI